MVYVMVVKYDSELKGKLTQISAAAFLVLISEST